ncbi:unnamed protein product [Hymenolepis diminuta]|uniref:Sfi1 spindle body domain-containing protein n=1 Tax=Hymenolepis diminuta TaxID=6216 RepID=A0A564ZBH1_HYMDI|nr:unnamed protein product [Hymenolepis diminuta]
MDQFKRSEALKVKEKANRERGELYHRSLCLRYFGYLPWRNYVQQQRNNELYACRCDQIRIQRVHFLAWHRLIQEISARKQAMAEVCYRRILSRRIIYAFSELLTY